MKLNHVALLLACTGVSGGQSMDWTTISPVEAGFAPAKLEAWRSNLEAHRTTGLLVVRRGRIALEWYAPGWNPDRPHGTASMAKALTKTGVRALVFSIISRFMRTGGPVAPLIDDCITRGGGRLQHHCARLKSMEPAQRKWSRQRTPESRRPSPADRMVRRQIGEPS